MSASSDRALATIVKRIGETRKNPKALYFGAYVADGYVHVVEIWRGWDGNGLPIVRFKIAELEKAGIGTRLVDNRLALVDLSAPGRPAIPDLMTGAIKTAAIRVMTQRKLRRQTAALRSL